MFPVDPGSYEGSGLDAFQGHVDIADAVCDVALRCIPQLQAQTAFENITDRSPKTSIPSDKPHPGGYFIRVDAMSANPKNPHRVDTAATGHFKKKGTSLKQLNDVSGLVACNLFEIIQRGICVSVVTRPIFFI